jgi:hypothetical protein
MTVVKLRDEVGLITELARDTIDLIHRTDRVKAIKMLVEAHEILTLGLEIERRFPEYKDNPPWDQAAFQDLNGIRTELLVKWIEAFDPKVLLPRYYHKVGTLFKILNLKL